MFVLLLGIFLYAPYAYAMRTQPMKSNHNCVVVLKDGEQTVVPVNKLKNAGVIQGQMALQDIPAHVARYGALKKKGPVNVQDIHPLPLAVHVTFADRDEWHEFEAALYDNPKALGDRLRNKKRARTIVSIADFLDHAPLVQLGTDIWVEEEFSEDSELHPHLASLIGAKIIQQHTHILAQLPLYASRCTKLPRPAQRIGVSNWTCCVLANNKFVVTGSVNGNINVLDRSCGAVTSCAAHGREICDIQCTPFNSAQTNVFTTARTGVIKQWLVVNHAVTHVRTYQTDEDYPFAVHIHPAGRLIATDGTQTTDIWDTHLGTLVGRLPTGPCYSNGIKFHPVQDLIAAGNTAGQVRIFNVSSGELVATIALPHCQSCHLQYNQDGSRLAVGCDDGSVHLYDTINYRHITEFTHHREHVWGLEFIPNTHFLVSGSLDGKIKMWDLATLTCFRTMVMRSINDMRLSNNNELIVACNNYSIISIDLKPLLAHYLELKNYLTRDVSFKEAQLIKKACNIEEEDSIDGSQLINIGISPEKEVFEGMPSLIQTILKDEFNNSFVNRKRNKHIEDDDYQPSDQSE